MIKTRSMKKEIPLVKVNNLFIETKGVSLSSDLISELEKVRANVVFFKNQKPFAFISYFYPQDTRVLKAQLMLDEANKLVLAKDIVMGKLQNQLAVLKSLRKSSMISKLTLAKAKEIFEDCIFKLREITWLEKSDIFSAEARFASVYWQTIASVIPHEYNFNTRIKRPATDCINAALNYGYGILSAYVLSSLVKASLHVQIGLLHADAPNRNSLVFDVMEPFRPFVDRKIITLFTKRMFYKDRDFDEKTLLLSQGGREKVIERMRKLEKETVKYAGKERSFLSAMQIFCYRIKDFVLGKRAKVEVPKL